MRCGKRRASLFDPHPPRAVSCLPMKKNVSKKKLAAVQRMYDNLLRSVGVPATNGAPLKMDDAELSKITKRLCGKTAEELRPLARKQLNHTPSKREVIEAALGVRHECGISYIRKMRRASMGASRRGRKFYEDLQRFGAAVVSEDGKLFPGSLGKGPTLEEMTLD